ncbi:MAG: GNAT family protein [Anaerolineae bacterium]
MIQGNFICLRPVKQADLSLLEAWQNDVEIQSEYNAFGLKRFDNQERAFAEHGFLTAQLSTLMIVTPAGEAVGTMSFHQVHYGPNSGSLAYNIGLNIVPTHRGKGYGTEAQRLLADYLLRTYPIARVEASTDVTNLPEQRSLEKAGFRREGVLRSAQWRSGAWHDMVLYSKVRGE